MAEETKKPKIDLKARLGKTMVGSGGSAVPLPVPGAMPGSGHGMPGNPSAPPGDLSLPPFGDRTSSPPSSRPMPAPMGMSPGIPLPAFAQAVRPQAPAPAPVQGAAAQTIKIEMGEEVQEQQKRAGRKSVVFAAIGAVVGLTMGVVVGGLRADSQRANQAVLGAGALEGEVKTANGKMEELSVMLDQGAEAIQAKKYPDDLAAGLTSLQIPFDTNTLGGKNVGALPAKILRNLLVYTKEVEDLNEKKDSLRNLLSGLKKPVEQAWADEKDPKFAFAVVFGGPPEKMAAELVRVKDPFKLKADWPKELPIMKREMVQGRPKEVEKKAARWIKGDLTGETALIIPVDPQSVAGFTSDQTVLSMRKAMIDMKTLLDGDRSDPQNETMGLVKMGEALSNDLNNLSLQK